MPSSPPRPSSRRSFASSSASPRRRLRPSSDRRCGNYIERLDRPARRRRKRRTADHGLERRRRRRRKMVSEKPALTLLSGLAAGVLGGAWVGDLAGRNRLITFDIGGTSADIGIVVDGRFAETDARSTSIAGFPLLMPMIDIHTIGAGGGSIAYVDRGGAFQVGPRSAGAVPGPAAYGRGGEADRDRRQRRARPARQERFPRRQHEARRAGRSRDQPPGRAARPAGKTRPPRACSPSSTATWPTPSARAPCRRASIRATSRWSRSAAPGRCTASKSRACSAFPR